jgi:outer membrane protein assembly factor BamB
LDGAIGDWPQFRGPRASGIGEGRSAPTVWNIETGANVRWKTAIPGLGHACPIVSGDCVFIVTATSSNDNPQLRPGLYGDIASVEGETEHAWQLYCLSRNTGEVLWRRTIHQGQPTIKRHTKASHANSTPATDGEHLVVFLGSEGLYCYDLCGNLLWKRDLGLLDSGYYRAPAAQWGFGSSPIIYGDRVIVQCDVQNNSFIAAFDIHSGRPIWRTARDDVPGWGTPTIYEGPGGTQLIVNGYRHAGGYDPQTGQERWRLSRGGDIPVPTPIVAHDLIFLSSSHGRDRPLTAVRPEATGDITPSAEATSSKHLAWYKRREGIYMQTPLVYGEHLYACRTNGVLSCFVATTGKLLYRERLGGGSFTASPVASDGKLYFTSELGDVYVVRAGPKYKLLATNAMHDICMATPAISDGLLIVRTKRFVYAIGEPVTEEGAPRRFAGRCFLLRRRCGMVRPCPRDLLERLGVRRRR